MGLGIARVLLALSLIMSFTAQAFADRVERTVAKNRKTAVGAYSTYSRVNCDGGEVPQMRVRMKPKNGKISFAQHSWKMGEDTGRCAGKRVKGTVVYYTPNRGYRGEDKFSVGFTMFKYDEGATTKPVSDTYFIQVK